MNKLEESAFAWKYEVYGAYVYQTVTVCGVCVRGWPGVIDVCKTESCCCVRVVYALLIPYTSWHLSYYTPHNLIFALSVPCRCQQWCHRTVCAVRCRRLEASARCSLLQPLSKPQLPTGEHRGGQQAVRIRRTQREIPHCTLGPIPGGNGFSCWKSRKTKDTHKNKIKSEISFLWLIYLFFYIPYCCFLRWAIWWTKTAYNPTHSNWKDSCGLITCRTFVCLYIVTRILSVFGVTTFLFEGWRIWAKSIIALYCGDKAQSVV